MDDQPRGKICHLLCSVLCSVSCQKWYRENSYRSIWQSIQTLCSWKISFKNLRWCPDPIWWWLGRATAPMWNLWDEDRQTDTCLTASFQGQPG